MTVEKDHRKFSHEVSTSIIDDEDAIRRMTNYFKQSNADELLKYIKRYEQSHDRHS